VFILSDFSINFSTVVCHKTIAFDSFLCDSLLPNTLLEETLLFIDKVDLVLLVRFIGGFSLVLWMFLFSYSTEGVLEPEEDHLCTSCGFLL
jgi:hypothetical protein